MQPSLNPLDPHTVAEFTAIAAKAASLNAADRAEAERRVKNYQDHVDQQHGLVQTLLHIASSNTEASVFCSIVLKNTVKLCWNAASAEHCVQDEDKATLRNTIIRCMLTASPAVQRNLAETTALIADVDFPLAWPDALTLIVQTLDSNASLSVRCAALSTAHSILSKYRTPAEMSESFVLELRTIYSTLLRPLLQSMNMLLGICEGRSSPLVTTNSSNDSHHNRNSRTMPAVTTTGPLTLADTRLACKGVVYTVECLRDMTALDLGDEFIWSIKDIVSLFLRCLKLQNVSLMADHAGAAVVIEMKSIVTSCVTHFLNDFDEDFEKDAREFLSMVWNMLADPASASSAMDDLAIRGLELLTSACRGVNAAAFDSDEVVRNLVHQVILPNMTLRDDDLESYSAEPETYIQRDVEGSDLHTRRRAAGELLRALVVAVPGRARALLATETTRLFTEAASDWKAKDLAIYLASSLAIEGQHVDVQRGATQQLGTIVPFNDFVHNTILAELAADVTPQSPAIIKADCLRVVASFRTHLDPTLFPRLLEVLSVWIAHRDYVVRTYAAHTLDRLLLVRAAPQHVSPVTTARPPAADSHEGYVVTEDMLAPYAATVLQHLCLAVQDTEQPTSAYFVQCLMRVCHRLPCCVTPYVGDLVISLNVTLTSAVRNPPHALFSYCLFEVFSKCIALAPAQGGAIEQVLWANLIYILANDVIEYVPYALQILGQLLRSYAHDRPPGSPISPTTTSQPPPQYASLLAPLLEPGMYAQRGNIPAIVCLLTAFVELYPSYVHEQGMTGKLLDAFAYLIKLKNYDHEGLNILTTMLLHYPAAVMEQYLTQVFRLLMERLQQARTPKYVRIIIIFMSVVVIVRGANEPVRRLNELQDNLFLMFLTKVWLVNVQKITGKVERKVCVVALAKLLCDCAELQQSEHGAVWASSVYTCLRMIHAAVEQDDRTSFAPQTHTAQDLAQLQKLAETGFTNSFCPLQEAVQKPVDVCADIVDPDLYFRQRMKELLRGPGAGLVAVLQRSLTPELLALVQ